MPSRSTDVEEEHWILTTEEGLRLLETVAKQRVFRPVDLARWRREASMDQVSAAIRIAQTRRRAAGKFERAERMWMDPIGFEQSTAETVARHKAKRFLGARVVDLCCGIGADALSLGAGSNVIAVDLDPGVCRRAVWNTEVYEVADSVLVVNQRAEAMPIPVGSLVHVDPDRRGNSSNPRAKDIEGYQPGLDFLQDLARTAVGGGFKLGPASNFQEHFTPERFEIEVISLGGECKEATAWFGSLKTCQRRATSLPTGATWTDRDAPLGVYAGLSEVSQWVYDPDPALIRSGLLDGFARAHGLTRFVSGVDYLSTTERTHFPFLTAFEVLEILPLDRKILKAAIAKREIGRLEIKTKGNGTVIKPEELRKMLRPEGKNEATLLVASGEGAAKVILARRVPDHD